MKSIKNAASLSRMLILLLLVTHVPRFQLTAQDRTGRQGKIGDLGFVPS